jgi:4-hydroxybenzoate polyprenyltransferase
LASGKLNQKLALSSAFFFFILALTVSSLTSGRLLFMALLFFALQLSYTFFFKKIPVIDALVIAGAYILRVYTGEMVTGYHLSVWLMLSVVSLALFLAIAKRRAELALLSDNKEISIAKTRASLARYNTSLLDIYLSLFATSTWIAYGFYTFTQIPHYPGPKLLQKVLPWIAQLEPRKWLMLSIPFVLYGLMRYLQLIYEQGQGEAPERLLFLDKNLFLTVIGWGISLIFSIYLI